MNEQQFPANLLCADLHRIPTWKKKTGKKNTHDMITGIDIYGARRRSDSESLHGSAPNDCFSARHVIANFIFVPKQSSAPKSLKGGMSLLPGVTGHYPLHSLFFGPRLFSYFGSSTFYPVYVRHNLHGNVSLMSFSIPPSHTLYIVGMVRLLLLKQVKYSSICTLTLPRIC